MFSLERPGGWVAGSMALDELMKCFLRFAGFLKKIFLGIGYIQCGVSHFCCLLEHGCGCQWLGWAWQQHTRSATR